jgi:prepilin-type N-terminal cleavage/methylation domain-containing protein
MKRLRSGPLAAAFTLAEILVTVAIIGLISAVAIPIYSNIQKGSEESVAADHVEALNRAVASFTQACWKLPTAPDPSSTADEFAVVRSLQYKFPANSRKPGSPFFDQRYNPATSSSSGELRIRWNGRTFELLKAGTSGTGLKFTAGGGDYGTAPFGFPTDYKPQGAQ